MECWLEHDLGSLHPYHEADSMFNHWDPQASFAWFDSVFLFGDSSLIPRNCTLGCYTKTGEKLYYVVVSFNKEWEKSFQL